MAQIQPLLMTAALTLVTVCGEGSVIASHTQTLTTVTQNLAAVNNSARDFFEVGLTQFEHEIGRFSQRGQLALEGLLDIDPEVLEPDLRPLEQPNVSQQKDTLVAPE